MREPLTLAERRKIQEGLSEGKSCSEISREIGRGKTTVITEVRINEGKKAYCANTAHERALTRQRGLSQRYKENPDNHPMSRIKRRIENLEMQVEILYDTLKEILNDKKNK